MNTAGKFPKPEVWRPIFLAVLTECASVTDACKAAGITSQGAYRARLQSSKFRADWAEAINTAVDSLEKEAWRRGRDGFDKPVFYQGGECGVIREYSDSLLTFLLKAHRPEKFRENIKITSTGLNDGPIEHATVNYQGNEVSDFWQAVREMRMYEPKPEDA